MLENVRAENRMKVNNSNISLSFVTDITDLFTFGDWVCCLFGRGHSFLWFFFLFCFLHFDPVSSSGVYPSGEKTRSLPAIVTCLPVSCSRRWKSSCFVPRCNVMVTVLVRLRPRPGRVWIIRGVRHSERVTERQPGKNMASLAFSSSDSEYSVFG